MSASVWSPVKDKTDPTHGKIALENEILRVKVGSEVYGTSIGDSDRDEMGIFVEPMDHVLGLDRYDQYVTRTAAKGVKSGPGDLDLTIYSLRKFVSLCSNGSPSLILALWSPGSAILSTTCEGDVLLTNRSLFLSQTTGRRFMGYLDSQRKKAIGQWAHGDTTQRPELVQEHGFDVKFAAHMVRLGVMGHELLTTGQVSLPMTGQWRTDLQALRRGERSLEWALAKAEEYEDLLADIVHARDSDLPKRPDRRLINELLIRLQMRYWGLT